MPQIYAVLLLAERRERRLNRLLASALGPKPQICRHEDPHQTGEWKGMILSSLADLPVTQHLIVTNAAAGRSVVELSVVGIDSPARG
jgi:hypothetical protein